VVEQQETAGVCGMCRGAEERMLGFGFGGEPKEEAAW